MPEELSDAELTAMVERDQGDSSGESRRRLELATPGTALLRDDKGLVWDADDRCIPYTWPELRAKIEETRGGRGIIAADFDELLRYGYGNPHDRRAHFTRLVAEATGDDDIEMLAQILAIMLIDPWAANLQGGWFIHRLRMGDGLHEFDSHRACRLLNRLYDVNPVTTSVVMLTLQEFVTDEGLPKRRKLLALIAEAGGLRGEVAALLQPPRVFLSYAREDQAVVERLREDLRQNGLGVWMDTHDLLPGEDWENKIRRSLSEHEFAVVCLSRAAIRKRGFFQVELKAAARMQEERADSDVFIIPARIDPLLDVADLPRQLAALHVADLADDWDEGVARITRTIVGHRR